MHYGLNASFCDILMLFVVVAAAAADLLINIIVDY